MNFDEAMIERVVERVMQRLSGPQIPLEASGRHVHVCRADLDKLYGPGYQLTRVSDLSQPGQFVCQERLRVVGPKGEFGNVVILGPERDETQVELSATDALMIGVKAPVRLSGNIAGTPGVKLVGPKGEVELQEGVIVAERHIHMTPEDAARFGLKDGQAVNVRVQGTRSCTFHNVILRVSPKFRTFMHIDYDEANACGFAKGTVGTIIA